jgi:ABC-type glycerol-3-phosphate transport system permease component
VLLAVDGSIRGLPQEFHLLPRDPTLDRFVEAWTREGHPLDYLGLLRNSLFVSGMAALISLAFGTSMAYAFARLRFAGRQVGLVAILIGAFLPAIALATPMFILFFALDNTFPVLKDLGFRGSLLALALIYAALVMPLTVWLMRAAFRAVPEDLEQAAFIDGASRWVAFTRITLRIAAPSILASALIAFLFGYSEFAIAWLFATSEENLTLAMILTTASSGIYSTNWGAVAAHALLMAAPVIVIVVVLQRVLLRGALLGSSAD